MKNFHKSVLICAISLLMVTLLAFAPKANAQAPPDPSNPYDLTGQCQNSMLDYFIGIESGTPTTDDPTIANIMNHWYGDSVTVSGYGWDYSLYSGNAALGLEGYFEDSIGGSAYPLINEYALWGYITTTQATYLYQISNLVDSLSLGHVDTSTFVTNLAGIESDLLTNMTDTMRVLPLAVLSAARASYYYWSTQFDNPPPIHTIGQLTVAAIEGAFFGGEFDSWLPGLGVGLIFYTHSSCAIPTDTEIAISAAIIAAQTVASYAPRFMLSPGTWANNGNIATFSGSCSVVSPQWCCNLAASFTAAPQCDTQYLTWEKGQTPLNSPDCFCIDLKIHWADLYGCTYPICGFDVTFDPGSFDPLCSICSVPTGWTSDTNDPGIIHFYYNGSGCSGAVLPLDFLFCGQNPPGTSVGLTVTAYHCQTDNNGECIGAIGTVGCSIPLSCSICDDAESSVINSPSYSLTVDAGHPNPATSSIQFDFSSDREGRMSMTLVNILGKTVSTLSTRVSNGDGSTTIALTGVQPGTYYCVFEINGTRLTRRIQVK